MLLKAVPKLLWYMTSLVPELLERLAIRIDGALGFWCSAPFGETLGRDKFANGLLANLELPGDSRNGSSLLMQRYHLVIEGKTPLP